MHLRVALLVISGNLRTSFWYLAEDITETDFTAGEWIGITDYWHAEGSDRLLWLGDEVK